ncbi:efflux RND transporter periplasmic adaptor subunit [Oscillatoria sp. CS-180]|uniref:efflux RND transporter periplasmic adaptor subunit n=1 Tax=Oscillatoria sp. CS-180 TaxID=3021720 RepID=UPI00232DACE7|nr:efflux RND transporter periplasmic adaptor subunit [Oscillatoria sp. CS-180]MDB9524565.1 efflux RND transporter periplasmic adaptor subunit [Oscillatoria sp. CS-180]
MSNPISSRPPVLGTGMNFPGHKLRSHPRWLIGLGLVGLLLVGIPVVRTQLTSSTDETEAPSTAASVSTVETLTVELVSSYEVARTYTGEVAALRASDLGFERGGELISVLVEEGDRVSIGQPLAQLDIQNLQTHRQQLEAQKLEAEARLLELERGARQEDIAAARAAVRDIESQLELQEIQRSRREFLYEAGAISREQLDEFAFGAETLIARLDRAQSDLDELLNGTRPEQIAAQQAVVQQLAASVADVDVDIDKSTLRAPFDGIVSTQQVDEGTVVSTGQSVVRLVENETPEARIGLPEDVASRLRVGESVTVNLDTERYSATVKSLLPEVDADTRTQVVVFQIEAAAIATVNPGQTVRVEITETIPTAGIWLPTSALAQDIRGLWSAYGLTPTDAEGMYEVQSQSVEILHQESNRALVRGTLQPGDLVVADGVHRLVPGQQVQPLD